MDKINEKVLNVASEFWVRIIRYGKDHDNGADDATSLMCQFLADSGSQKVPEENLDIFREEFKKNLEKSRLEWPRVKYLDVYCDYHPDPRLSEAAEVANIKENQFPWKCGTIIGVDYVEEHRPYRKFEHEFDKMIYCDKSYFPKKIKQLEEDIEYYKNEPLSEYFNEENKNNILKYKNEDLKFYQDMNDKIKDFYVREDFKDYINGGE